MRTPHSNAAPAHVSLRHEAAPAVCAGAPLRLPVSGARPRKTAPRTAAVLGLTLLATFGGCVVPQPPGKGRMYRLVEGRTGRGYWLYLPEDYVATGGARDDGRGWPLVMTFHGMRPWDDSGPQVREWQYEADNWGYVVCAPDLLTCDMIGIGGFPLSRVHDNLRRDEEAIVAIMDDVIERANVDPDHVLSTSWSSGGYIAHYIVNRHPERFSCITTRQSNFSSEIMSSEQAALYRDMPIAIIYTQNDFGICRTESTEAIAWYREHGFRNVRGGVVMDFGHERTPQYAAAFFAEQCGARPKRPPVSLARIRMEYVPEEEVTRVAAALPIDSTSSLDWLAPQATSPPAATDGHRQAVRPAERPALADSTRPPAAQPAAQPTRPAPRSTATTSPEPRSPRVDYIFARPPQPRPANPPSQAPSTVTEPLRSATPPARNATPKPPTQHERQRAARAPAVPPTAARTRGLLGDLLPPPRRRVGLSHVPRVSLRVLPPVGQEPMPIQFQAWPDGSVPSDAEILWTDNGRPIARGLTGSYTLTTPGDHRIEVLIKHNGDVIRRGATVVTVLPRLPGD